MVSEVTDMDKCLSFSAGESNHTVIVIRIIH